MRVSIHQPQYLPWLGYFYKIAKSDLFILFDTVQYPRGKHFGNRNQIKTAQGAQWLTVPVLDRSELVLYSDIQIDQKQKWAHKHWRGIDLSYRKAPHYERYAEGLSAMYLEREWASLTDLNQSLLQWCFDALGITARVVRASAMNVSREGLETDDYIFALLQAAGATQYISGQGAGSQRYIDRDAFAAKGIELWLYDFNAPQYSQLWGAFVQGLSVLDVLFNCGEQARELLDQGGALHHG